MEAAAIGWLEAGASDGTGKETRPALGDAAGQRYWRWERLSHQPVRSLTGNVVASVPSARVREESPALRRGTNGFM